ncbi:type II secretion system F family protein [Streptomyces sp. NPDC001732]
MSGITVGTGPGAAAVCAVLGTALWSALAGLRRRRAGRRRGAVLLAVSPERCRRGYKVSGGRAKEWIAPLAAVATGWVLLGGPLGCAAGLAGGYGAWRLQRARKGREREEEREEQARAARQLPLAADLLAACISAGAGPREAAEAVGESLGGPVGTSLARAAAEIRLGGEPTAAWGRFGEIPGAGALARCLDRAGSTGAPAAEPVARLAEAMRAERASAAVARAQRAGVLITGPVGFCFLPAFLAVGVAPVVMGLATGLLHTG